MKSVMIAATLACAAGAAAQVSPIGPFVGDRQEGFQTQWNPGRCVFCPDFDVFQGNAKIVDDAGQSNMHVTGGWGFSCSIGAHNTPWIFGSAGCVARYDFNPGEEPGQFGGYFGSNSPTMGGRIEFYDAGGALIAQDVINTEPCGSWNWHGWEFTVPVAKAKVIGNFGCGGFVMMDDMEWSAFTAGCYPDCDTSTGVGVLDIFDFLCFQNRYDLGAPYACDCDTTTGVGVCDIFDFLCFQNAYDQGCP